MEKLTETAIKAAISAGKRIVEIYPTDFEVHYKNDHTPLTQADREAHRIICTLLGETNIPVRSEEDERCDDIPEKEGKEFWLVDPLDGTEGFVKRNGEFAVNIALIENEIPVLGVVFIPVNKTLFFGDASLGSHKVVLLNFEEDLSLDNLIDKGQKLPLVNKENHPYTVLKSLSHPTGETIEYIQRLKKEKGNIRILARGSAIKFCLMAEGIADEYPRLSHLKPWDIAAGHAIVKFAGFDVFRFGSCCELTYKPTSAEMSWFVVKKTHP